MDNMFKQTAIPYMTLNMSHAMLLQETHNLYL